MKLGRTSSAGKVVTVQGRYVAVVRFFPATSYGSSAPATLTPRLANLTQVVRSGDFEAVLSYAFGLADGVVGSGGVVRADADAAQRQPW